LGAAVSGFGCVGERAGNIEPELDAWMSRLHGGNDWL
jgi:hypothetical protein